MLARFRNWKIPPSLFYLRRVKPSPPPYLTLERLEPRCKNNRLVKSMPITLFYILRKRNCSQLQAIHLILPPTLKFLAFHGQEKIDL